jgi:16S rRNA (cytosine967-C5)-methyltransferase
VSRDRERLSWPPREDLLEHLSVVHSHPRWLVERWVERYGVSETEAWLTFNNQPAPLCLAVNRRLLTREALAEELAADGVTTQPTGRAAYGLQVTDGRALATRAFREGRFVVQDEASQLIGDLASPPAGATVLDLCASPGGKTLALSAFVGQSGHVVACDVRSPRVRLLSKTIERCRIENARVVHVSADGTLPFAAGQFDQVLVDAPCSGLGTVRRDPDIRWRRSAADLPRFADAQRALLARAAELVKPGGTLVYSTCSSEPEENQHVVAGFLRDQPGFSEQRTHQTLPFKDGLEAFFGAVLRRA